jgi:hypothetical protein
VLLPASFDCRGIRSPSATGEGWHVLYVLDDLKVVDVSCHVACWDAHVVPLFKGRSGQLTLWSRLRSRLAATQEPCASETVPRRFSVLHTQRLVVAACRTGVLSSQHRATHRHCYNSWHTPKVATSCLGMCTSITPSSSSSKAHAADVVQPMPVTCCTNGSISKSSHSHACSLPS